MNWFQIIFVPLLCLLAILEVRAFLRNRQWIHTARLLVWLSASVLICFPSLSSRLAWVLGIGRGTDLVFYGFALASTAFGFHLYGRQHRLRRDLVTLARRDAIAGAVTGDELGEQETPDG